MSTHIQRTCVFTRCPDTEYVPRKSLCTPTSIYALDLNDWGNDAASLQENILEHMNYADSGVEDVSYHLMGQSCDIKRPLKALFDDPIQHAPQRRSKGVMLHLTLKGKQGDVKGLQEVAGDSRTLGKTNKELICAEDEDLKHIDKHEGMRDI